MTAFDRREEAFERKFAHDEQLKFKAEARRGKLAAAWAAAKLGKTGAAALAYAEDVVAAALQGPGDEFLFRRLRADFDAAGVAQSDHQIRREMDVLMHQALAEARQSG